MNTKTKLNITSVIGVKDGIDQIFSLINEYLESYSQNTDENAEIESCRNYVHQLNGLLEMLELKGITIVSQQMEKLIEALVHQNIKPDSLVVDTLKQTTHALQRYLNELIDGAEDNPLRLFPVYRNLMQAQGIKNILESDLFVSNMVSEPPLQAASSYLDPSERRTSAKQISAEYQAGLLKWLRDTANKDDLQQMANAISRIEKFPGSIDQRSFWWACSGFMDSLLHQELTIDLSARRLCGKIEQEIRRLAEDAPAATERLMREVLYQIANSNLDSERIREISRAYEWPSQFVSSNNQTNAQIAIEAETQASTLKAMRETLVEANNNWREYSAGKKENLKLLSTDMEQLKRLVIKTKCPPLEKLIAIISGSVAYLLIRPQDMSEDLALEMATSLLLVQTSLDDFNNLSPEFPEQVESLSKRLRVITIGKKDGSDLPDIPGPDAIEYKTQTDELQEKVSLEMLANLGKIEGIIDRFFLDHTLRSDLQKLPLLFNQISGVLIMLDLERANILLELCHGLVEKLLDPDYAIKESEQTLIADGLSSLGFFIEALKNTQSDNSNIIETALILFDNKAITEPSISTASASASADTIDTALTDEQIKETTASEIDPELLSIFLEEADEVLAEMAASLQLCRDDLTHIESLTTFRRGFHTLKGSGHMVKLQDLSEVAWNMEQVLNHWLNERKPIEQELIDLTTRAHHEFSIWCENLKQYGATEVSADELILIARNLMHGNVPETEIMVETSAATDQYSDTITSPETEINTNINIGDLTIPRDLFDIFTAEAREHLVTLKYELNALIEHPDQPLDHNFMLAAHTLSSNARSLGLMFIADLAFDLEQWLLLLLEDSTRPDETGLQCARNAIDLLGRMLENVNNQQLPEEADLQTGTSLSHELTLLLEQEKQQAEVEITGLQVNKLISQALPSNSLLIPQRIPPEPPQIYDTRDDINPELWHVFYEEAQELTPEIAGNLRAWCILPQDNNIPKALLRALHTLKGSARMAGAMYLGELIHSMEGGIENVICESIISVPMIERLEVDFDEINGRIERLQNPHLAEVQVTELEQTETSIDANDSSSFKSKETTQELEALSEEVEMPPQKSVLRVNAELIDRLVNESGEMSIIRSKVEAQLYNFKQSLLDLNDSVERLRGQLREVEIQAETKMQSHLEQTQENDPTFDPLEFDRFTRFQELTRLMAESVDDIVTVQQSLRSTHSTAEEAVTQQAQMNRQLQQELMRICTVPFGNVTEHFYRVIRQTARDLNKKVDLNIQGNEVEIDRGVLEKINSPLEHLLRNAVAHGIEEPDKRLQHNKAETGQVTINLRQEGNEVILTLSDDGNGLNLTCIRDEAIRLGLIQNDEILNNDQLMALIFEHGLTTSNEVTGIAGRGIGMDVVKNEISALGGRIEINSETNKGTTFSIYLPLTLAVAQTLMVGVGDSTYAVPAVIVEHIQELNTDALNEAYQNHQIEFNGKNYPFAYLSHLLGEMDQVPKIKRHNRLLLLHSGTLRLAIHVDELLGNSEVVVKNIGPQLVHAPGVEGATVMGDGKIIFIINPVKLMQRDEAQKIFTSPPVPVTTTQEEAKVNLTIMVVDDSLTVRKVTSRLLEREGCEVLIAKDGLGAIELLRETVPDIMLVDLEMPHMNGFELIRNVRNNPKTENLPIIIISSRTADKHRKMADDLGVNVFLGKPYNEEELLGHINNYIK